MIKSKFIQYKKLFSSAISLLICFTSISGEKLSSTSQAPNDILLPVLTKTQMLEDFDYMVKVIRDIFPAENVNKKVYGIDIFKKLKLYREKITGNETPYAFNQIISDALEACKGGHLWQSDNLYSLRKLRTRLKVHEAFVAKDAIDINHLYILEQNKEATRLPSANGAIKLIYHQGIYYNLCNFSIDGHSYKRGMELISVNGKKPSQILPLLQDKLDKFDYIRRIFYGKNYIGDDFYLLLNHHDKQSFVLTFKNKDNKIVHLALNCKNKIIASHKASCNLLDKRVSYFRKYQLLYLRIPYMKEADIPFYFTGIEKQASGQAIKAVVIDIRNNGGGSDYVWIKILKKIIAKPHNLKFSCAIKPNIRAWQAITREKDMSSISKTYFNELKSQEIPYLDNEKFKIYSYVIKIEPMPDSLKLRVPIFVIAHDIYSASGGLIAAAEKYDDIISVGSRNPATLGKALPPVYFSLPNSKIIFSMGPSIDISNSKTAEDVLHTQMEFEVKMTAKERIEYELKKYHNMPENLDVESKVKWWLENKDPYFKRVLELIKDKKFKTIKNGK